MSTPPREAAGVELPGIELPGIELPALERLKLSRARLRLAMTPAPAPARGTRSRSWLSRLGELPTVGAVVDSVTAWWSNHPLRPVTRVATEASGAIIRPVAQHSPWSLVLLAALAGALLTWSRPWRWAIRSAVFAGLVPQLASRVVSSLPIEMWMTVLGNAFAGRRASAASAGSPTSSVAGAQNPPL